MLGTSEETIVQIVVYLLFVVYFVAHANCIAYLYFFYFSRPPSLFVQGCFLALCFCPLAVQVCVKLVRNDK